MRKFVLAFGVSALLASGTASAASSTAPPSSPPGNDDDFQVPEDWVTLVDDTNTVTVAVPNSWTDVDTAPGSNPDGTLSPRISAASDLGVFVATFDAPGVAFWATTYTADDQALMDGYGLTRGCRRKEVVPYDDGAFVGIEGVWSSCGDTGAPSWHQIVASPPSRSFTFVLQVQLTTDADTPMLDGVLASFNFTPEGAALTGPVAPSTGLDQPTTSITTTTPTTVTPTTAAVTPLPPVSGTVAPDSRLLVDDLGVISVSVPAEWVASETQPRENDDGTDRPWIAATTDLALFLPPDGTEDTFGVPGVLYEALPYTADIAGQLSRVSYADQCTEQGVQPYSDGVFSGLTQTFIDCGSTDTRIINIVANQADDSYTVFLLLQLTSVSTDQDYDTVMSSFTMVGPAPGAGDTVTSTT